MTLRLHREKFVGPEDTPRPPEPPQQSPNAPVKEPPDSPQTEPDAPVREPGPDSPPKWG